MKIIELDKVNSTNEYCKRLTFLEDTVVVAKRQTAGKGTKGRCFISDNGGLFVSVLRNPKIRAEEAFKIMVNGCVAVCKTLEKFGVPAVIRWANDVLVGDKKISGTLIENTFSNGYITRAIVGTGINVNNIIPPQIKDIAISMKDYLGKELCLDEVKSEFIKNSFKEYSIKDYKGYINWLGKKIILKADGDEREVTALDILENGRLKADWGGNIIEVSSAEVSLRLYGNMS